ncbi:unnamed protein product [Prorocentrum cordatum]|uniref:Uncharacterized protein n=1 Tax=Prorocentrum cordatum TaxID=2364126 RepID=A0ABN9TR51_9DINO|nr:unnamed protein product [Polarella glacialis]
MLQLSEGASSIVDGRDAVIFLAGEAAQLLRRQAGADDEAAAPGLRPAPHALRLRPGFGWRAWYGVMLLPPEDAPVRGDAEDAAGASTFGEMWNAARTAVTRHGSTEVLALGCGAGKLLADQLGGCSEGQIECWMTCMDVSTLTDCRGGMWSPTGVGDVAAFESLTATVRGRGDRREVARPDGQHVQHVPAGVHAVQLAAGAGAGAAGGERRALQDDIRGDWRDHVHGWLQDDFTVT